MKINNYELNNNAIGILEYIQSYSTNFTVFEDKVDKNKEVHDNIRKGIDSPITTGIGVEVSFVGIRYPKSSSITEVLKLTKKNILIKIDNLFCVNPDFKTDIFDTNFSKVSPKNEKMNKSADELLILLAYQLEKGNSRIDIRKIKSEIRSFQSVLKKYGIGNEYITVESHTGVIDSLSAIYRADRAIGKDLYKSQLHGYIRITDAGIKYLVDNNIYNPFIFEVDIKDGMDFIEQNRSYLEVLDKLKFEYKFRKNSEDKIKVIATVSSFKLYQKYLVIMNEDRKNWDTFEYSASLETSSSFK